VLCVQFFPFDRAKFQKIFNGQQINKKTRITKEPDHIIHHAESKND